MKAEDAHRCSSPDVFHRRSDWNEAGLFIAKMKFIPAPASSSSLPPGAWGRPPSKVCSEVSFEITAAAENYIFTFFFFFFFFLPARHKRRAGSDPMEYRHPLEHAAG